MKKANNSDSIIFAKGSIDDIGAATEDDNYCMGISDILRSEYDLRLEEEICLTTAREIYIKSRS